jgi:hypothetical protein
MLADEKARNEHDSRIANDRQAGEIGDTHRALDELRYILHEKSKVGQAL